MVCNEQNSVNNPSDTQGDMYVLEYQIKQSSVKLDAIFLSI